jgi:hypothetical protein
MTAIRKPSDHGQQYDFRCIVLFQLACFHGNYQIYGWKIYIEMYPFEKLCIVHSLYMYTYMYIIT